jgi:hypothetical protein
MHRLVNRRAALLGGAGLLLAGCETTQDMFDRVVGTSKTPLPGERRAVLAAERGVAVDTEAANRALGLPEARLNAEWPVSAGRRAMRPGTWRWAARWPRRGAPPSAAATPIAGG